MFRSDFLVLIFVVFQVIWCTELTFELEDNAKECFHEEIVNKTKCTLEFQVSTIFSLGSIPSLLLSAYKI